MNRISSVPFHPTRPQQTRLSTSRDDKTVVRKFTAEEFSKEVDRGSRDADLVALGRAQFTVSFGESNLGVAQSFNNTGMDSDPADNRFDYTVDKPTAGYTRANLTPGQEECRVHIDDDDGDAPFDLHYKVGKDVISASLGNLEGYCEVIMPRSGSGLITVLTNG